MPLDDAAVVAAPRRTRWIAVALLVATFLTGMLAGGAVDRFVLFRQHRLLPTTGARFVAARVVRVLDRKLDLTPTQEAEIQRIVESRRKEVESVWRAMQPQVRAQLSKTNEEIEAVLTPDQREKFRHLRDQWEKRAHRLFGEQP